MDLVRCKSMGSSTSFGWEERTVERGTMSLTVGIVAVQT